MNIIVNKKKFVWTVIILLLVFGTVFFGINSFFQAKQIKELEKELETRKTNGRVAAFLDLFIQKVLKTDKEVSFDDRLNLENAVRNIEDADILSKWEQFTAGENEEQIQSRVKGLLEALVKKISY